jgi:hypothetical protein
VDHAYEKLGAFYLGKAVDPASGSRTEDLLLYDSRDLTTHGVIIGMTGSGKTGLGIGLLEEAAIDRIPVIAIDPKGDLANLLLGFPELAPADFRPWINEETARQKGLDPDAFAAREAETWRAGLADWQQDGERIRRLRQNADLVVYTPGSTAGAPVSVLRSFDAPPRALVDDPDAFRERIQTTVTGLLGLLGLDVDPVRSRDHILLSSLLDDAWRQGRSLDLGALIGAIQQPPFTRLGVMELETVYPSKDRFGLAMQLNALLASPAFGAWMEGEPLDIGSMLYTTSGTPRVSIFSVAHLGDAERMFFVTMLLSAILAWTRSQPGTTSLRALVYMDEVFGFFPPVANPPSKAPMLTLLKQARAFGVGLVLATQNPIDLDYKGLGNTGTWFIGRLQTDRDKARVLEALDGAMAGANPIPRADLDRLISGLGKRVFLMHSVHRPAPVLFSTRWAMSYLAGPLTLAQLRVLARRDGATAGVGVAAAPAPAAPSYALPTATSSTAPATPTVPADRVAAPPASAAPRRALAGSRPILAPGIRQVFVPPAYGAPSVTYRPAIYAAADVRYALARAGLDEVRSLQVLVPHAGGPAPFSIEDARLVDLVPDRLDSEPMDGAAFGELPPEASQARTYDRWGRDLSRWVQGAAPITLLESRARKLVSRPNETEREFRMRLADLAHEERDAQADRIRRRYEGRFRTLQDRLRRAEQAVERKKGQSQQAMLSTGVAALGGLLGAVLGGSGRGQIGRAGTAVRGAGRVVQTRQDVMHAGETVEAVRTQIADLEQELAEELRRFDPRAGAEEPLEEFAVRPALTGISMRLVALAWLPWTVDTGGRAVPLFDAGAATPKGSR